MYCTRRHFFSALGRTVLNDLSSTVRAVGKLAFDQTNSDADPPRATWLRPPGALPEPSFLKTCTKCTACQEVCPYQSIRRLGPEFGAASGTPVIISTESPCYLCDDMPCITACEPHALQPLMREEVAMGTASIHTVDCYAAMGQPCDYCVSRCPLKGTAISLDPAGIPRIHNDGCTGCGVCAYLCPAGVIDIRASVAVA